MRALSSWAWTVRPGESWIKLELEFTVAPENAAALVRVITRLAANPILRETLGRNGRRHIVEHFSPQQTANAYIAVLKGIVGREQPSIAA